ncbi:MAG TPA: ornithine cyclodeaminase family protein [Solirubrobacteraceae bacterium]|jgi:ornithine cyclodeaminase
MLILSRAEIRELLDLDALIDELAVAMADLSAGRVSMPERIAALVPEHDGLLGAMPGYVPSREALVAKLVTLFPRNAATSVPTHQAVIVAFDPHTGSPTALLDGSEITAVRTGASSALSVRLLAREGASVLAILGTGVQARSHARAVARVRPIAEVRIAGRDPGKARTLAAELAAELCLPVDAVDSYGDAVANADIVCATTHALEPVVHRQSIAPGTHITSVGHNPAGRELDDETLVDSLVCVESRQAALAPPPAGSNDLVEPISAGKIGPDHIHAELGELVSGTKPGRASEDQITLYKSAGVAVQDAAAAMLVLKAAREAGAGVDVAV